MSMVLKNESGNTKLVALLGGLATGYLVSFRPDLAGFGIANDSPQYQALIAVVGTVSFLTLLYSLHMSFIGGKPTKQLFHEVTAKVAELEKLLVEANSKIREFDEQLARHLRTVSRRVPERIAMSKKIVRALERRLNEVKGLVSSRDTFELLSAYDLLQDKLSFSTSPLDSLIDAEPMPALESYEWQPALEKLFNYIETDLSKAVQVQNQLRRVA